MSKNLYTILGVDESADAGQLRAAYDEQLARCPAGDDLRRMALKEAFGTLTHPQRRAAYDASLHNASRRVAVAPTQVPGGASRWRLSLIALVVLLGAGAWLANRGRPAPAPVTVTVTRVVGSPSAIDTPAASPDSPGAAGAAALQEGGAILTPEALFATASASIVRINSEIPGQRASVGSGVVVERGVVVTNCHVLQGSTEWKVRHRNDSLDASVMVADEVHDLCKLSVPGLDAPAVRLADSSVLKVGQKVYAIGSPQGLDLTLSDGLVSALRQGPEGTYIQTTAPVSPGSSGGGLFADDGRLVGIITFQVKAGQNLNFALPAEWIGRMSATVRAVEAPALAPPPAPGAAPAAQAPPAPRFSGPLLGTWSCFGPLTGRGLVYQFEADGSVSGTSDGKPFSGRYDLSGRSLTIRGGGAIAFDVEELRNDRMVLSAGQGRRLVCNR
jgi:S1-C subfamily serine protease